MQQKLTITKRAQFSGHTGSIYGLYVSIATGKVFTGGTDGFVVEWDLQKPEEGRLVCRLNQPIYSIFLFEPLQQLWVGLASGNIHVVDLPSKQELKNIALHQKGVYDLKEFNQRIYAAGGDGCVSCFDAHTHELLMKKQFSEKSIRVISIEKDKGRMAIGSSDFSIHLLSENLEKFHTKITAHQNSVFSLAFSPDGQYLLSGGRDALLKVWDFEKGMNLQKEIPAHNLHIHSLSTLGANFFLSSSMDKTIKIWSLRDFELLKVIDKARNQSHANSVNKISWINENEFVSIGDDKLMMHWVLNS